MLLPILNSFKKNKKKQCRTHTWQQAEATFAASFSDVACTIEEAGPPPPPTPPPPANVKQHHAIYSAYNAGSWTPDCPGGCPGGNPFGCSNFSNVFFSPALGLVTTNTTLCPADFDPAKQNGAR